MMFDRIKRWWRAEVDIGAGPGTEVTVCAASNGTEYDVWVNGKRHTVRARWWDTKRSIARKLRGLFRASR